MNNKKRYIGFKILILALMLDSRSVFADDETTPPSIDGLEKGVYVVVTVELDQLMLMRKPKLFLELKVFATTWSMDEIKSCWTVSIYNCVGNRMEDYVDEFIKFYNLNNKEEPGILRIDFPIYSGEESLEEISWEEFFKKFEENNKLSFLYYQDKYQDKTSSGEMSRFYRFVRRESEKTYR